MSGRPAHWELAITILAWGLAFLIVWHAKNYG